MIIKEKVFKFSKDFCIFFQNCLRIAPISAISGMLYVSLRRLKMVTNSRYITKLIPIYAQNKMALKQILSKSCTKSGLGEA